MDAQQAANEQAAKIGAQVRRARRSHDWTQEELAHEAGVAPGTVNRIENGRNTRPGNLRAVLEALGIEDVASSRPTEVNDGVKLALDIVEKWLTAIEDKDERNQAVQELIRFATLRD